MKTGFEGKSTATLRTLRDNVEAGVIAVGMRIARGEKTHAEDVALVPMRVGLVEVMDAELLRRGEHVPAPWWEQED